ncbi:hypothetical protein NQL31_000234 [Lotmaria passim]
MAHYLDVKHDDEVFAARLQEVNREMDTLLNKTSRTRHEMDRSAAEVRMGVPLSYSTTGEGIRRSSTSPSFLYGVDGVTGSSSALRDDLTRSVVSAELTQWIHTHLPTLVAPLVEAQVQRHLHQLRDTVADVRARQTEVEESLKEVKEQLRMHRRDMQAGLAAIQRGVQCDMADHQRLIDGRLSAWREEVQQAKDDVHTLQMQSRTEAERVDRRLDEALQRRERHVQDTLDNLDHDLQQWRLALQHDVEKDVQSSHAQHDALEEHVAQLQGALSSTTHMASRCTAELQRLMEDSVDRASEVRLCRRDVNRLEMLVQCSALHTVTKKEAAVCLAAKSGKDGDKKTSAAAKDDTSNAHALSSVVALAEEVAHVNEKVQAVVSRMDCLDRQVRQLDVALARGAAAAIASRGSFFDSVRDGGDESLFNRSAASTRRPSISQFSSLPTSRGVVGNARPFSSTNSSPDYDSTTSRSVATDLQGRHEGTGSAFLIPAAQPVDITRRHRGEAAVMQAGPEPYAVYHPPTSHLSNSSLPFEDDAEDPKPMPIVISDGSSAPGTMTSGMVSAKRWAAGSREGSSPPQRRAPPRVIPVETPTGGEAGTADAAAKTSSSLSASPAKAPAMATSSSKSSSMSPPVSNHSERSSDSRDGHAEDGKDEGHGGSPSAFSLSRYGESSAVGRGGSGPASRRGSRTDDGGGGDGQALASSSSPVDSYVSDTPAAAAAAASSPEDSYVSDTPPAGKAPASSPDRFGRYTPAPASDSEGERDNEVISRSALD